MDYTKSSPVSKVAPTEGTNTVPDAHFATQSITIHVDGDVFHVHKDVLTAHSKPFASMLSGPMLEASTNSITLHDVKRATFARVCAFLNTGDYHAFDTDLIFPLSHRIKKHPHLDQTVRSIPYNPTRMKMLLEPWGYRQCMIAHRMYVEPPESESCLRTFKAHAQVYVFAEMFDMEDLKKLAIYRLHVELYMMTKSNLNSGIGAFPALLQYVYSNTTARGDKSDPLRFLVMRFATVFARELLQVARKEDAPAGQRLLDLTEFVDDLLDEQALLSSKALAIRWRAPRG